MTTSRMEGFSDGVFAVAITLLSLGLVVPHHASSGSLAHKLLAEWPSYAAYAVSFLTIGIIWINHHVALRRLTRPDHALLMLNLLLLMSIVTIPFATDLVANYLRQGENGKIATAVFSGDLAWMCLSFVAFNWFMLCRRRELLDPSIAQVRPRLVLTRAAVGVIPYLVCIGLAFISPYIPLTITGVIAIYYALPVSAADLDG